MWLDTTTLLRGLIFFVYGTTILISLIFSISLDTYLKIENYFKFEIIPILITLSPLEKNMDFFNDWLMSRNKIAGPILIFFSFVAGKLFYDIIGRF